MQCLQKPEVKGALGARVLGGYGLDVVVGYRTLVLCKNLCLVLIVEPSFHPPSYLFKVNYLVVFI